MTVTHIGGPTVLIEFGGWRLLTDPTFDPPGESYSFGWGTRSTKLTGPAISASELGPIDAVLLTHDNHSDNLDSQGRAVLRQAPVVVTTASAARRLGKQAHGLAPWSRTFLRSSGRTPIQVTAIPARHGPPGSRPIVGDVIGFALQWAGQQNGVVWISGDTVLYRDLREAVRQLDIGVAIVHLGGVRFPITGPLHYTMTAERAVELCSFIEPRIVIPIHYEGWSHFRQRNERARNAFDASAISSRVRWLPPGDPAEVVI